MRRHASIHPRSILTELVEWARGRDQLLVRAGDDLPLMVLSYSAGQAAYAEEVEAALRQTFRQLSPGTRERYNHILPRLPSLVVVVLRARNACSCLGHYHPPGTEGRAARRLKADTGLRVGEVDLAVEAIRQWEPMPLASLAAEPPPELKLEVGEFRFRAALLAILLHELEHLAFPELSEREIRRRSTDFYLASLREFFSQEFGRSYGI
jgi:hypothetical protein